MDSPLKILHVVVNMNRGGAETLIMNLYRKKNREKFKFYFLTFKSGVFDSEITNMGGKVHRIPYITDVGHSGFIQELNYFFKENWNYKIIHSHMDKMSGFILKSAKKAKIPIRIAHSHNTASEGGVFANAYKWYAGNHILTSATHLYACSNKAATWLFGNRSDQAHILKNGIEIEKFKFCRNVRDSIRNELQLGQDTFVVGHVGRFLPQKNHLFLIDLFSSINKQVSDSKLLLVGDGPLRNKVESRVNELNLKDKVKFLGVRENINQLLQVFDIFVMPSLHEGLPVTLIEAQGAGLPCFISNNITQEVDIGNGLVQYLPLKNKESWISAIANFKIENQSRENSLSALSEKGYDIKQTAKDTEQMYLMLGEK